MLIVLYALATGLSLHPCILLVCGPNTYALQTSDANVHGFAVCAHVVYAYGPLYVKSADAPLLHTLGCQECRNTCVTKQVGQLLHTCHVIDGHELLTDITRITFML